MSDYIQTERQATTAQGLDPIVNALRDAKSDRPAVGAVLGEDIMTPEPYDDDYDDEPVDSCLNSVDGHWYVITYGRAPYQWHAADCPTCQPI